MESSGSHHTLDLTEDGHVYSWGSNLLEQVPRASTRRHTARLRPRSCAAWPRRGMHSADRPSLRKQERIQQLGPLYYLRRFLEWSAETA